VAADGLQALVGNGYDVNRNVERAWKVKDYVVYLLEPAATKGSMTQVRSGSYIVPVLRGYLVVSFGRTSIG
jgi:hypothetical protein